VLIILLPLPTMAFITSASRRQNRGMIRDKGLKKEYVPAPLKNFCITTTTIILFYYIIYIYNKNIYKEKNKKNSNQY